MKLVVVSVDCRQHVTADRAVFGEAALVGSEKNGSGRFTDAFNFDETKLAGVYIQARDVIAEVFFVNVIDLTTPVFLVLHDHLHRDRFHFWVWLQAADFGLGSARMRKHKGAGRSARLPEAKERVVG